ncbi:unnamed protein product [Rotaria magnacalcarata]
MNEPTTKANSSTTDSLKIIVLGDSAVGKSKLLERFLINSYVDARCSTFAVNIFKHTAKVDGKQFDIEFWDTAGQEKFDNIHHSYFHQAHACIMVFNGNSLNRIHELSSTQEKTLSLPLSPKKIISQFDRKKVELFKFLFGGGLLGHPIFDATRKITYKNLDRWYNELRDIRPHIPCLCVANKVDVATEVTKKSFSFPKKHDMPLYYVSAADGTNVVRLFRDAIRLANAYRTSDTQDFIDQVLRELEIINDDTTTKN